ncbi:YicC/YloC family endoribonuclease [Clostridium grantii]|uniref:TIGR00255 family protein n=1 Tax=Clostridium grantii DSM 8605 TaxID=1121316 RepID=A0A1M5QSR1_9CLOT|nr:YicC/YloC family endoribonuclease [Clostridium grantii]SHH17164.1 TIGR00255 family protein [Clostridium grantii DSM 8605]
MSNSMTGFGRAISLEESTRGFTIEMKSVNHRYLDINIKMPRNYLQIENKIRGLVKAKLKRGKIDIFISQNSYGKDDYQVSFNKDLADNYMKCLTEIKNNYDVVDNISVALISKFPDVVVIEKKEEDINHVWDELSQLVNEAIENLSNMRMIEGEKLKLDIINKCDLIMNIVSQIEEKSFLVVMDYKKKLEERISELMDKSDIDEYRIANEIAIFADKASIDEELVRLKSHISQIKGTFTELEPVGRKLDFIIQEMNREANTIASKSSDLETVNLTIELKSLIEKIREQVQNIE